MNSTSGLRSEILNAREKMVRGREDLRKQHDSGSPGIQVCARLTDLFDTVVLDLFQSAICEVAEDSDLDSQSISLVAHGGYGRRDVAPHSDFDLMLLHPPGTDERVLPFVRRFTQNLYDTGVQLGFSVRTPSQACRLALKDITVFTSLAESRFLDGDAELFDKFISQFRRNTGRRSRSLIAAIDASRREERAKYGETVYLLRPNVKRSRGGLRDIQLVRWIGFARYGECDFENLFQANAISKDDQRKLRAAREFLLRLRNELHFHADKSQDILEREEQVRLAEVFGYQGNEAVLPVENLMRDYFEHTSQVRYVSAHFLASIMNRGGVRRFFAPLLAHQVERDFRVGPIHIGATRKGLQKLRGDLGHVLRLMDLANLYNRRIDHHTWQAIRESMASGDPVQLTPEAIGRFLSLMSQPGRLANLLRRLHELRVLEKLIPAFAHARCLLQFNEYHKYTVDEHSILAVQRATEFLDDDGPVGDAYRGIKDKQTLHLALLLHDLGKGYPENHSEVGLRLAAETAELLGLPERQTETLKFLVHKHLVMSHLAFRRDTSDESVVLQFAVDVGSPNVLKMLFVLTCADLAAVGPGVLNQRKLNVLAELYLRAMDHLTGDRASGRFEKQMDEVREQVRDRIKDDDDPSWWEMQLAALPRGYLLGCSPKQIADELKVLRDLPANDAIAWGRYLPERQVVEYTIGAYDQIAPGVFHRLTGTLTSKGQLIHTAEINTLANSLLLDRFHVTDTDFRGEPPAERIVEISSALEASLKKSSDKPPTFRRVWQNNSDAASSALSPLPARVRVDNSTAEKHTIIDIFAHDRMGLLYTISRTLFELGLSVSVAKIGTYLDQVVDVFYVSDENGKKIEDDERITHIRHRLLEAIESVEQETAP